MKMVYCKRKIRERCKQKREKSRANSACTFANDSGESRDEKDKRDSGGKTATFSDTQTGSTVFSSEPPDMVYTGMTYKSRYRDPQRDSDVSMHGRPMEAASVAIIAGVPKLRYWIAAVYETGERIILRW